MVQTWATGTTGPGSFHGANITVNSPFLTATYSGTNVYSSGSGTESFSSGDFYWEVNIVASGNTSMFVGVANTSWADATQETGGDANPSNSVGYRNAGELWMNVSQLFTGLPTFVTGDTVAVALSVTRLAKVFFRRNHLSSWSAWVPSSGDPVAGTGGQALTQVVAHPILPAYSLNANADSITAKFAASSWIGPAPSGYVPFDPSTCSAALLGVGCSVALARKIEENPIVARRQLILPHKGR